MMITILNKFKKDNKTRLPWVGTDLTCKLGPFLPMPVRPQLRSLKVVVRDHVEDVAIPERERDDNRALTPFALQFTALH